MYAIERFPEALRKAYLKGKCKHRKPKYDILFAVKKKFKILEEKTGSLRFVMVDNVCVKVDEKSIKHTHLSVYPPDGEVHISVPSGTSDAQIRFYVMQKWMWLCEKRKKATAHTRQPAREYISGEEHFSRGQSYRLKIEQTNDVPIGVHIEGDYLVVSVRANSPIKKRAEVLDDWYRSDLKSVLDSMIKKWERELSVAVAEWDVKRMNMRWGSCNRAKAKVIFNLELAKRPLHCVEYVVAHELAHLIERDHNDRFQGILFTHLPNWKDVRKELNDFPLSGGIAGE